MNTGYWHWAKQRYLRDRVVIGACGSAKKAKPGAAYQAQEVGVSYEGYSGWMHSHSELIQFQYIDLQAL